MNFYKFGFNNQEHFYDNRWFDERYTNFNRITIAPKTAQVELILELLKGFQPPFGVLYVLVAPRLGYAQGRYQCVKPISYDELKEFVLRFKEYFETDGRHHIWFASASTNQLLVYDHHNVIYVYNNDEYCKTFLNKKKYRKDKITFPVPHEHKFNPENDLYEEQIMENYKWKYFLLKEDDDYYK